MPLDEATGIVHWKKPVVFDHQVDTSQEVRETHLEDAVDDQKSERVALMVTRVTGRSAAEGEALAVLYVLNVPDTVSETNNVAQGSGTACPECLHVLMAIGLKGIADAVSVRHVRSNTLLQEPSVTTHGAPWHRDTGEDELNLLRGVRKPNTKLPMLLSTDGVALCGSDQILEYLDSRFPDVTISATHGAYEYGLAIKPLWGILRLWWAGRLVEQQRAASPPIEEVDEQYTDKVSVEVAAREREEIAAQLMIEEYMEGLDDLCSALDGVAFALRHLS
jgi:glutathione S-transferase